MNKMIVGGASVPASLVVKMIGCGSSAASPDRNKLSLVMSAKLGYCRKKTNENNYAADDENPIILSLSRSF